MYTDKFTNCYRYSDGYDRIFANFYESANGYDYAFSHGDAAGNVNPSDRHIHEHADSD